MFGTFLATLAAGDLLRIEQSLDAMGSVYSVVAYGEDRGKLMAAADTAFEEVRRLDRMMSNYRVDSELSRVNREAYNAPVPVSDEMFRLLAICQEYHRESDGAFDISVGPLMKTWGFYKGSGHLPHRAEIRGVQRRIGFGKVRLDALNRTVRFDEEGMELDPGGVGKGYAVDKMADILKRARIPAAFISAGSSSIYAFGAPPGEKGWKVSIRHPRNLAKGVADIELRDMSLSTSGTSEKFFRAEGRIYSHIMDPRTGYPAKGMLAVSVLAPRTLDSEVWTKPAFINGREWLAKKTKIDAARPSSKMKDFRFFLCEDDKQGGTDHPCAWLQ
ncbi:MAG: FAD:protein FMN transferase [Candidatus Solibacter usitatus]|nr:FAD:protein FMN transferase [Candidatus Solibacter usitatus]